MNKRTLCTGVMAVVVLLGGMPLSAHDLFFRAKSYFTQPGGEALVEVYNGTFSKSENAVKRDRPVVVEVVGPSSREALSPDRWDDTKEPKSVVRLTTPAAGTYVLAAYLQPRLLSLPGDEFNAYLKEEGIEDVLAMRRTQRRLAEPSKERYQKFIKTLIQAGGVSTMNATIALGYDAEIVPEQNPYTLKPGDALTVRCLVKGQPWAHKVIFAAGRVGNTDRRLAAQRLITDADGRATVRLSTAGVWYVKFVSMIEVSGDSEANYESRWSTISFAVMPKR